ncbi:hypothetical protein NC652_021840 [Populus alba x Populus x berolinensis]|nr:hypothetical protein NC652_021840 [Populus alba x Populus x berolinensis]
MVTAINELHCFSDNELMLWKVILDAKKFQQTFQLTVMLYLFLGSFLPPCIGLLSRELWHKKHKLMHNMFSTFISKLQIYARTNLTHCSKYMHIRNI